MQSADFHVFSNSYPENAPREEFVKIFTVKINSNYKKLDYILLTIITRIHFK